MLVVGPAAQAASFVIIVEAHWVGVAELAFAFCRPCSMSEEERTVRNQAKDIDTSFFICQVSVFRLSGALEQIHMTQELAQCTERQPSSKSFSPEVPRT